MIYLKLETKPISIKELLIALFSFKLGKNIYSCQTYSNEECTEIECHAGVYRSVDDIVEIVKTYFPHASEKEIFRELLLLTIKMNDVQYYIGMMSCEEIRRPTVFFQEGEWFFTSEPNSQELTNSKYKNWNNVLRIAELTKGEIEC